MNYYVIANEARDQFLRADGEWCNSLDDAEHLTLDDAVMKQVELIRREIVTEICEVPLMHEAVYADIHARIDELQERLASIGVHLSTEIGEGDETTWTFEFDNIGTKLTVTLEGPDTWSVET